MGVADLAIVRLNEEAVAAEIVDDAGPDEGVLRVLEPDVALAREVVLALNAADRLVLTSGIVCLDEGRGKGTRSRGDILGARPMVMRGGSRVGGGQQWG